MDGDPSQEDRIRLIGRLFFIFSMYDVRLRSFPYSKVFSFVQNLGCFYRIHWAESWTYGQNRGQLCVSS